MGCRGQVKVIGEYSGDVYLYSHWRAIDLPGIVWEVLSKRQRWDDSEYLARMIFSEMIKDELDEETGYGIGTKEHGDIEILVTVNCIANTIKVMIILNSILLTS